MSLADMAGAIERNAVPVVFINVLLQQLGLPVPAVPTLLLAGSLALAPTQVAVALAAAVAASLIADVLWYGAGRAFGYRVLSGLCKLSINPATCVNQTEARFVRWGLPSLVLAKFIPGFSTVAPPIAGALRMSIAGFGLAAGIGALLWAGLALSAGWLLRGSAPDFIAMLDRNTATAAVILGGALSLWIAWKLWQRRRFRQLAAVPHISMAELQAALRGNNPPLLLDLRGPMMIADTGPLPGAVVARLEQLDLAVADWPKHKPVVTLCACPQDATAIQAALLLTARGFALARPLRGGYEAWLKAAAAAP